jgi:hypothetical protein
MQTLQPNQPVLLHQPTGQLVLKVLALIGDPLLHPGDLQAGFVSSARTFLAP